ncbi:hypothetical protein JL100_021415 [Skermanella mucosa]|uniref:hypothetical protein n=1 Tax=Skermanella mucosa TaxID=1789672 RepID=UPI00192C9EA8|nr:hypothetical protein [Skermanella mucosa]UEM19629.1 hypothetical protein JL100_021415 [Skermanella mucosa]
MSLAMSLPLRHAILCAILLLAPSSASAQGVIPYDTYRDAYGAPNHAGNLTPLPDDRQLLGSSLPPADPFSERVRPARGYGEIADIGASYWEWRSDRLRQMRDPPGRTDTVGSASDNR